MKIWNFITNMYIGLLKMNALPWFHLINVLRFQVLNQRRVFIYYDFLDAPRFDLVARHNSAW